MSGYNFLDGVRVLEVAQLGPSSLGGYLADMGADVIKIEGRDGDPVRYSGTPALGSPDGPGLLHLRWNRGKRSLGLNLKSEQGAKIFRQLAGQADIVIEGMRAGVLKRLGLGFEDLKAVNPRIVFCSISGLGSTGPYSELGSHGPSFDAFGGLSSLNPYALSPDERKATDWAPIGMHAMGLNAALGTLAALNRAQRTGEGAYIEVTGAESAAHWLPEGLNSALNAQKLHARQGFLNSRDKMAGWPRLCAYATRDGKKVFFQGLFPKFWARFCAVLDRPDLAALYANAADSGEADERAHVELVELFASRDFDEWMTMFNDHDIPGGPAHTPRSLVEDPHFVARDNVYEVEQPGVGVLRLGTTPVKTVGQDFAPDAAPELGQHSGQVLGELLGLDEQAIQRLCADEVVFSAVR
ncbi:CaiB/BaiF CoA transferase family protein [Paraburkholderia bannensis]|uniref:CaiB/BaiF CoA transferase family protein n=1 Tax=Paraburkholderia bannensis TaxID=765414 RepID=UPI002AC35CC2|nr:CoA transferase [Paraburkholderia bannensis]